MLLTRLGLKSPPASGFVCLEHPSGNSAIRSHEEKEQIAAHTHRQPRVSPSQKPAPTASHVSKSAHWTVHRAEELPSGAQATWNCERQQTVLGVVYFTDNCETIFHCWPEDDGQRKALHWRGSLSTSRRGYPWGGGICRRVISGHKWSIVHSFISTVFLEHFHVWTHNYLGLHIPNEALDWSQGTDLPSPESRRKQSWN